MRLAAAGARMLVLTLFAAATPGGVLAQTGGPGTEAGVAAHWRLDDGAGTVARDSSGQGADCDRKGTRWIPGDRALEFRGQGDWLQARSAQAANIRGAFTIAFWIRPETWADQYSCGILSKKLSDADRGYVIYSDGFAPAKITLRIAGTAGGHPMLTSASDVDEGSWQHWAVTYDAAAQTVTWYKNGKPDKVYRQIAIGDTTNGTPLRLGYAHTWGGSFDGRMRDVRIYSRALSPKDVRGLCATAPKRARVRTVPIRWRVIRTRYPTTDVVVAGCTVQDAGAKGDGRTDDTQAFRSAIYAMARAGGGVVFVPEGRYVIRGNLNVPTGVTLRGDWLPPTASGPQCGTILMAYAGRGDADDRPFIALRQSTGVKDLAIWYPEQSAAHIVPYPFSIEQMGCTSATVQNITLVNSYQGIRTDKGSALHYIHGVYGSPLWVGLQIDFVADTGRVDNVSFGPGVWSSSGLPGAPRKGGPHATWMRANGTGMLFRRYEWIYSAFVTLRGYRTGVRMVNSPTLGETNGQMYRYDIRDCGLGVDIIDANFAGISFTSCHLEGVDYGLVTRPTFNTRLLLHSCEIRGGKRAALLDGITDQSMVFERCRFKGGVDRVRGDLVMLGCAFAAAGDHIVLERGVNAVTIAGAAFDGPARIADNSVSGKVRVSPEPVATAAVPACPPPVDRTLKPGRARLFVVTRRAHGVRHADDTAAIQRVLRGAARAGGGVVFLPPGTWDVRGHLDVPSGVELRGSADVEHHTRGLGSVVRVYAGRHSAGGSPTIVMRARSGMRGLTFYYPEQRYDAIVAYPFLIQGRGADIYVANTSVMNAYQLADFRSHRCDRHYVDYVGGAPLRTGIVVGGGSTGGVVRNVQFNPHYWSTSPFADCPGRNPTASVQNTNPVWTYEYRNLEAFVFGNCRNELQYENTIFGSRIGLHFVSEHGIGPSGLVLGHGTDGSMVSMAFDGVGPQGIDVVNSQVVTMDCLEVPPSAEKRYIHCGPNLRSGVRMVNSTFWGSPANAIVVQGGSLTVDLASFCHYAPLAVDGGTVRLVGVYLGQTQSRGAELAVSGTGRVQAVGCLSPLGLGAGPEPSSGAVAVTLDGKRR